MKKLFFSTLLAAAMLTSCSSDEPAANTGNDDGGQGGFLALNICAPSSASGRATDGGYEVGSDVENKAEKGMFLLFNASGTQSQSPQSIDLTWEPAYDPADPNANRDKISEAVLVVKNEQNKPAATEILVILNCPYSDTDLQNKSKDEVLALINDCADINTMNFVMSNSVYSENCATQIADKIMNTEEAAKANPVEVYVERVLAKVRVTDMSSITNPAQTGATTGNLGAKITIDGAEKNLTIDITGIEVANKANMSYIFKHGYNTWSSYAGAVDVPNFRSYWATSAEGTAGFDYVNQSYTQITAAALGTSFTDYVQENTIQSGNDNSGTFVDNSTKQTCILVTAQLKDENGQPLTFVKWGGKFWGKDNFGANAANVIRDKFRVATTDGSVTKYLTLPPEAFVWLEPSECPAEYKVWENSMKVNADYAGTIVTKDATTGDWGASATVVDVNAYLKDNLKVLMWNDGKAYYYVPIESFLLDGVTPRIGIVRNHIYDLTLNKIEGVGVPVWNPEETIFPERPDEDDLFYLAARVNILKWKVASQTVDLH